ncbi:MAG: hypothetical protein IKF78_05975 [Atopobiaceae bacterium]|nr:hypothetical protein [Atopobiaceae bacterium]
MKSNRTQPAQIRYLQSTLSIAGLGTIAFSAWSLVKTVMFFLLHNEETQRALLQLEANYPMPLLLVTIIVITLIDLCIRAYVGLSARAEGNGKRRGTLYLVVAGFVAVTNALSIFLVIANPGSAVSVLDSIVTLAIEATSLGTLILMIRSAMQLRRLRGTSE